MSKKMEIAGLKSYITKLKNHHKMVVAGYKASLTKASGQSSIAYRRKRSK